MLDAYRNSLSDKARYNFDSDMRRWLQWRHSDDLFVPSNPDEVRDFVIFCANVGFDRGTLTHKSILHILSSLAGLHTKVLEIEDPTKSIIVKSELKKLRREKGDNQKQAVALRASENVPFPSWCKARKHEIAIPSIARLKQSCGIKTARGLRDRVLLELGEDLGRRNLDFHLFNDDTFSRRSDGRGDVLIRRSKTDQRGEGRTKIIGRPTMDDIEGWVRLKGKNEKAGERPLLTRVNQDGSTGARLSKTGINYVLRQIVIDVLLEDYSEITREVATEIAQAVSSHSFRVGLAQDGIAGNHSGEEIRQKGDWTNDRRVIAYGRNLDPASGAVAKLRELIPLR